jgi:hypothetical protein
MQFQHHDVDAIAASHVRRPRGGFLPHSMARPTYGQRRPEAAQGGDHATQLAAATTGVILDEHKRHHGTR